MVQRSIDVLEYEGDNAIEVSAVGQALPDADLDNPGDNGARPHVIESTAFAAVAFSNSDPTDAASGLDDFDHRMGDPRVDFLDPAEVADSAYLSYDADGTVVTLGDDPEPDLRPPLTAQGAVRDFGPAPSGLPNQSVRCVTPGAAGGLSAPDDPAFQSSASFSVSFWLRADANASRIPIVGKGIDDSGAAGWSVGGDAVSGRFWIETEEPGNDSMGSGAHARFSNSSNQYTPLIWQHFVFVADFSAGATPPTFRLYRNGSLLPSPVNTGTFQATRHDNSQPFRVLGGSGFYYAADYTVPVNLLDVHYWADVVLDAADAVTLYNGGAPLIAVPGTLAVSARAVYSLRNLDQSGLADIAGNCPPLVNVGGCSVSSEFP